MKKVFFIVFVALVVCQIQSKAQSDRGLPPVTTQEVSYTYDAAGNRKTRSIITVGKGGLDENEEPKGSLDGREILVYPNPVKEELTIEIWKGDNEDNYRFLLFDMNGKLITESTQQGNGILPFDMSIYQNGIYLLIIETGDGKKEFKIIKN